MTLIEIRERIDALDTVLLAAFTERMQLGKEAARCKRQQGLPILDEQREQAILRRVEEQAQAAYRPYARRFFEELFALSRAYQEEDE